MKLEFLPPSKLRPFRRNPRVNDQSVQAVARSIEQFGFISPIVVGPNNRICAGHARWKAAKLLGIKKVPVVRVDNLTGMTFAAYNIADNKIASLSGWEEDSLAALLRDLRAKEADLSSLGYSEAEIDALLTPEEDFDWDAFDEDMQSKTHSEYGLLPVKVRRRDKGRFKAAIKDYAAKQKMTGRDLAVIAGRVLGRLLKLHQ